MADVAATGESTLKRTLGPFSPGTLGLESDDQLPDRRLSSA
jgi:hypothetical protein